MPDERRDSGVVRLPHTPGTPLLTSLAFAYLPVFLLLSATVIVASVQDVPLALFLRDTTAVAGAPFYFGALSTIGILLWCATASMCLLTGGALSATFGESDRKQFLLCAGVLTSILMIDDTFLVHETVGPEYLGLKAEVLMAVYGGLTATFFYYYRRIIFRTDYYLLLLCLTFFAASVGFDSLQDYGLLPPLGIRSADLQFLLEDGSKLFGIAGWFHYFGRVCYGSLRMQGHTESSADYSW